MEKIRQMSRLEQILTFSIIWVTTGVVLALIAVAVLHMMS